MPFLFTNPIFLAALAGLGLPVLIHLLLKRKSQRLRFSTVRFFARQDEPASAKRKLRNLLLLLLRLLLFALLVLAFARPYLPLGATAAHARQRRQLILVFDRSASLQAGDSTGARWSSAQKAARELLAALQADDRAALVTCSARAKVASGFAPPTVVAQILADLKPGTGPGDLSEGLREAARLITLGDPKLVTSIAVVSDLQRAGAQNLGSVPLPANVEVKVVPVGDLAAPNISVAELNLEPTGDTKPHATLASFGDEDINALDTEFLVDGKEVFAKPLPLKAGGTTNLDLRLPTLKPGWHNAVFRIKPKDALSLDDARFQAFFIPEPVSVLVVEGRKAAHSYDEQGFFVTAALDPAFGTTNTGSTRFAIQKIGPDELANRLAAGSGQFHPEVVVLPAPKPLSGVAAKALSDFVKTGGGLLLFAGDELTASRFNTDFGDLSPVALRAVEAADNEFGWHLGEHDKNSALFASFRLPNSGNLALPSFTHRFALTPAGSSIVSARFEDGVPLLVGRAVGPGRVLFANTSADTAWNDWPKHKTFVPWLHSTVLFLAGRVAEDQLRGGANFIAGADGELELGAGARKAAFRLAGPDGKEATLTADDSGRLDLNLAQPGLYSLREVAGRELRRFAVNVPVSESDLAALRPAEFQQQIVRAPAEEASTLAAGLFGAARNQREFWRVLLLAALGLLFVETLIANRSHA